MSLLYKHLGDAGKCATSGEVREATHSGAEGHCGQVLLANLDLHKHNIRILNDGAMGARPRLYVSLLIHSLLYSDC